MAGVVVFTIASLLNGLATSSEWLIATRALQGLGAAMVSPAALSIITTTFKEGADRAKALAVWAAIAVGGAAVGLLLGGILTEYLSWEWAFFVNIPIGIASVLLSLRYVPESKVPTVGGVDVAGAVSVTAGLTLLVYTIVRTQENGWLSAQTIGLALASVALLAAFVMIERRSAAPLVRLGIFKIRSLTGANLSMLAVAGGMFSVFYFASIYLQQTLGFTPVQTGLAFLPLTAGIILFSGIAQQLIGRVGVREIGMVGMGLAAIGLLLLSRAPVDGTYLADVLPGILVMSAGLGLTFVPLTLIATTGVGNEDAGLASGIFNSSQQIGGALGPRDPLDGGGLADHGRAGLGGGEPVAGRAGLRPGGGLPGGVRDRRGAYAARRDPRRDPHPTPRRRDRPGPRDGARRHLVPSTMPEPLRSDARRNREKILAAASELFALEGPDLCVNDIARRAGVGHATVFRRFPTKDDLVLAMFEERLDELAAVAEAAAARDDPWEGLVELMTSIGERHARDRGLMEARRHPGVRLAQAGATTASASSSRSAACSERAQEAGVVRDDLEPADVMFLISAVAKSSPCHFEIPDLWRRYLGVVLDGMRPEPATPLAPPAPSMDEVERALGAATARAGAAQRQ